MYKKTGELISLCCLFSIHATFTAWPYFWSIQRDNTRSLILSIKTIEMGKTCGFSNPIFAIFYAAKTVKFATKICTLSRNSTLSVLMNHVITVLNLGASLEASHVKRPADPRESESRYTSRSLECVC